jgi:hypothetical protein
MAYIAVVLQVGINHALKPVHSRSCNLPRIPLIGRKSRTRKTLYTWFPTQYGTRNAAMKSDTPGAPIWHNHTTLRSRCRTAVSLCHPDALDSYRLGVSIEYGRGRHDIISSLPVTI